MILEIDYHCKMKKFLVTIIAVAFIQSLAAQMNVKKSIVGSWRVVGMEADGEAINFSDPEKFAESLFSHALKKEPGRTFTKEDSSGIVFAAALMYVLFKDMKFEFSRSGNFMLSMGDALKNKKDKKESSKGKYALQQNKLLITEEKSSETQTLDFKMPDAKTLILSNFRKSDEMNLVLTKN